MNTSRYELQDQGHLTTDWTPWLGPAADEMTGEQREQFEAEARVIEEQYPGVDLSDEREAALSAVVQRLLGDI